MIMRTEVLGHIRTLGLPISARNLFDLLTEVQQAGGAIPESQQELAATLKTSPSVLSRAMRRLCELNIVLRTTRYKYTLHPLVAGYETENDMETAISDALQQIADGELPPIAAQPPTKRHLAAVS
ncbi:winged helix-turn-helix domain-containing protein [Streptomyces sp. NRRL S-350]|uniref:winged helix-turn-helix domain-containing protein n=1 Tax=Streptomyces sp. NRRL S-350 TaxID=1463902 RepID=UPI000690B858|nr:winged helix-turn-helix domain-containing protein [Streptomyces sp. NRRL S-350]